MRRSSSPVQWPRPRTQVRRSTPRWRPSGSWLTPSKSRPQSSLNSREVAMGLEELSFEDLEQLREQITEYYETYYAELRTRISDHSSPLSYSLPDHFKGYR